MELPDRPRLNAIAGPILGEFLLTYTVAILGLWLASHTSDGAAGSLGLANQILETLYVLFRVLAIGMGVVITQLLGGQQIEGARKTALSGLGACSWAGLSVATFLLLANDLTLDVLNAPEEILPLVSPYLQLLAPAAVLDAYNLTMAAILRAHLHVRDSLRVMIAIHSTHLALAIPLMLGVGDWEGMGLYGFAVAMVISRALGLCLHLILWRRRMALVPTWRDWWVFQPRVLAPVLRIGIPGATGELGYRAAFMVSLAATARLGVVALATHSYVLQLLRYVFLISLSIGWACEIMVGRLIGAGQFRQAQELILKGVRSGILASGTVAVTAALAADPCRTNPVVDCRGTGNRPRLQPDPARRTARLGRRHLSGHRGRRLLLHCARYRFLLPRTQIRPARHLHRLCRRRMVSRPADDGTLALARLVTARTKRTAASAQDDVSGH